MACISHNAVPVQERIGPAASSSMAFDHTTARPALEIEARVGTRGVLVAGTATQGWGQKEKGRSSAGGRMQKTGGCV